MNDVKRLQIGTKRIKEYCGNCENMKRCDGSGVIAAYLKRPTDFIVKLNSKNQSIVLKRKTDKEIFALRVCDWNLTRRWCSAFQGRIK